jgi:type II secretory ATPase GspE/PulE/Tfp pilus assembly ATPase PilB-like protein
LFLGITLFFGIAFFLGIALEERILGRRKKERNMDTVDFHPNTFAKLDPSSPEFAIDAIDLLLPLAIARGASDVHLQPREDFWEILFRIDGVLSATETLPRSGVSDPVNRLMVMAGLPTYRSGQPMEGRLAWKDKQESETEVSARLGIYPTVHGPRAVIRLLRKDESHDSIESLGLSGDVTTKLTGLCDQTDGAILLSGPTGSGKTTTMYAMLRRIAEATPRRSVMTIEDPVESVIDGISQSELDVSAGMTLASALRSAVRQDSEVLLVSEIRDPETAEAALQASLTGHLVFSSLHATDIAASLRRLAHLGVPTYVVRSGIRAILTQRLLRTVCPDCQNQQRGDCKACFGTGYRGGRIAISQCIEFDGSDPVGEALADALESGASATQMRIAAEQAGGDDLRTRAANYISQGLTDQAEVYRVLGRTH